MFASEPLNPDFIMLEEQALRTWKTRRLAERVLEAPPGASEFASLPAPYAPFRRPGEADLLCLAATDVFQRYHRMRGRKVSRRAGWHTHGLRLELELDRQFGLSGQAGREAFGLAAFNEQARRATFNYLRDWEKLFERLATWQELEEAYATQARDYTETLWWAIQRLHERGLIQHETRMVTGCPRCGTARSAAEVEQGLAQTQLIAGFVRLPLVEEPGTSLLIYTEDPWQLTANTAVAADPDQEYVIIERPLAETVAGKAPATERIILARRALNNPALRQALGGQELRQGEGIPGRKLNGLRYHPLFTFLLPDQPAFMVVLDDSARLSESGLLPLAPAYGHLSRQAARQHNLPELHTIKADGVFLPEIGPWRGRPAWEAAGLILADLDRRGLLLHSQPVTRRRAFCTVCATPLLEAARPVWFVRPPEGEPDAWPLSRTGAWGAPLPVWQCRACRHTLVVGSLLELAQRSGRGMKSLELHRPAIDELSLACPQCGKPMQRSPELINDWFELGALAAARWHYPFENQANFEQNFPAALALAPQPGAGEWFPALQNTSQWLFGQPGAQQTLALPQVPVDEPPQPLEAPRPAAGWSLLAAHGADALRLALLSAAASASPQAVPLPVNAASLEGMQAELLLPLWQVYAVFSAHARRDNWQPGAATRLLAVLRKTPYTQLERWLLSELHLLIRRANAAYEAAALGELLPEIERFISLLTGWYLPQIAPRLRPRQPAEPRQSALAALYEVLVTFSKLLAPLAPFIAETLYQRLVAAPDPAAPESVHLSEWPYAEASLIDEELNTQMAETIELANFGLAARRQDGLQPHQPLSEAIFAFYDPARARRANAHAGLLAQALNVGQVKAVLWADPLLTFQLRPQATLLQARFGDRYARVRDAIWALPAAQAAVRLLNNDPVAVEVLNEILEIRPDEVDVRLNTSPGNFALVEAGRLVLLRTALTPELQQRGWVNWVIEQVLALRRQSTWSPVEPLRLSLQANSGLWLALHNQQAELLEATWCSELRQGEPGVGALTATLEFDGAPLRIALELLEDSQPGR